LFGVTPREVIASWNLFYSISILYGLNDCLKETLLLAPGWTFCSSFLAEICFIGDKVLWMFSRYTDLSLVFLSPLVSSFYCAWAA